MPKIFYGERLTDESALKAAVSIYAAEPLRKNGEEIAFDDLPADVRGLIIEQAQRTNIYRPDMEWIRAQCPAEFAEFDPR